jgi:D-xylose transport system substrate-binding protein
MTKNSNFFTFILILVLLLSCFPLFAVPARPTVAVVAIKIQKGMDASVIEPVTEAIMEEVVGSQAYTVLDRVYVDRVLTEQAFNVSAMVSNAQIAQVGQFLAADTVITGTAQKMDDVYILVVKMIDVKTGAITWQSSARSTGKLTVLVDMAHTLGKKLVTGSLMSPQEAAKTEAGPSAVGMKIGISFTNATNERYIRDKDQMIKLLTAAGFDVIFQDARQDARLQADQIKDMTAQGAKVIIAIPENGGMLAPMVDELSAKGVKFIAYDRLIPTGTISAYISFDNIAIGRSQAIAVLSARNKGNFVLLGGSPNDNNAYLFRKGQMEVLAPYIGSGQIQIVADQWVKDWNTNNAKILMQNILSQTKGMVDAVVASNDGTALGALDALRAVGLAGKVPISGQDATEAACNSIAKGELTSTIFKDARLLAPLACEYATTLATGKDLPEMTRYPLAELTGIPSMTGFVNCLFPPAMPVTRDNLKRLVVDSGFQSYDGVYRGGKDPPPK